MVQVLVLVSKLGSVGSLHKVHSAKLRLESRTLDFSLPPSTASLALSVDLVPTTGEWGQQKELRGSFMEENTAKEVQSVILTLDIITHNSLHLLFVDLLRRREEESCPVGRNKEDSSLTAITHGYETGNGRETGLHGKKYLQEEATFQVEHEGAGDVQGRG